MNDSVAQLLFSEHLWRWVMVESGTFMEAGNA